MTRNPERPLALITGATSGIGKSYAFLLAKEGYDLILTGRREPLIRDVAETLIQRFKVDVEVLLADFADPEGIQRLASRIQALERLDVLICNAGMAPDPGFVEHPLQGQQAMIRVHIDASVALTHAALPGMLARESGKIVYVASMAAFAPVPDQPVYGASKAFLVSFAEALHIDYGHRGIKFQCFCPGFTRTDFHARVGVAESVDKLKNVHWMDSDTAATTAWGAMKKAGVVIFAGLSNRVSMALLKCTPRRVYYWYANTYLRMS